jgi:hypothetical protein
VPMANVPYRIKTGDTYPPLTVELRESCKQTDTGAFQDDDGNWVRLINLTTAQSLRFVLRSQSLVQVIEGPGVNVEKTDGPSALDPARGNVPGNRGMAQYVWEVGDTVDSNAAADWKGEVEITWVAGPPPKIETVPVDPALNFSVIIALDND